MATTTTTVIQVEHALKALEEAIREYNLTAHRLSLLPASAKRADGIQYEIELNRNAEAPAAIINIDLKVPLSDHGCCCQCTHLGPQTAACPY